LFSSSQPIVPRTNSSKPQWGEEPSVLAAGVSLLQCLFDILLGLFSLRNFFECVVANSTLEAFEFEGITCGHQVVVVDDLDERLHLRSLLHTLLSHALGDLGWVSLNAKGRC